MKAQPKITDCEKCVRIASNCSELPFDEMSMIEREGDVLIVRCTHFKRRDNNKYYRCIR